MTMGLIKSISKKVPQTHTQKKKNHGLQGFISNQQFREETNKTDLSFKSKHIRQIQEQLDCQALMVCELGKSPQHGAATCQTVMLAATIKTFIINPKQFAIKKNCQSEQEAETVIFKHLRTHAKEVPGRKQWKKSKCPRARPQIKSKTQLPTLDHHNQTDNTTPTNLSVRPIISQYKHPWQKSMKMVNRCLTQLNNYIHHDSEFMGWDISSMNDLRETVKVVNQRYFPRRDMHTTDLDLILKSSKTTQSPVSEPICAEDDLKDMFNNIPRTELIYSVNFVVQRAEEQQKTRSRRPLTFFISKAKKSNDKMSHTCYSSDFTIISKADETNNLKRPGSGTKTSHKCKTCLFIAT